MELGVPAVRRSQTSSTQHTTVLLGGAPRRRALDGVARSIPPLAPAFSARPASGIGTRSPRLVDGRPPALGTETRHELQTSVVARQARSGPPGSAGVDLAGASPNLLAHSAVACRARNPHHAVLVGDGELVGGGLGRGIVERLARHDDVECGRYRSGAVKRESSETAELISHS